MKVIVLTRGDLTDKLGMLFQNQQPMQRCVTERSGVSRGHSTEAKKKPREGLNVERSLNFAGLESNAMKAANPDKSGTTSVR